MTRITLRVQPRASSNRIVGCDRGVWQVRVTAPPVEGDANEAVVALLAKCLGVRRSAIRIEQGQSGRTKVVSVEGVAEEAVNQRLEACSAGGSRGF